MEINFLLKSWLILLLALLLCTCQQRPLSSQSVNNSILASIRADNDFSTVRDTISPTSFIPERVTSVVENLLKKNEMEFVIDQVFKIQSDSAFSIYVLKLLGQYNEIRYYYIGYNPDNKSATFDPPYINGKWMERNESGFSKKIGYSKVHYYFLRMWMKTVKKKLP